MGDIWNLLILQPMVNILLWIYSLIGDFGLAIIVFTILTRVITHPLMVAQMKSTKVLTELQQSKEWLETAKKYKDDKQKLQMEQAKLFQEKGVNPAASCLPLLIQFPLMIGVYQAITTNMAASPLQLLDFSKKIYPFINASVLIPLKSQFLWMDLGQPERLYILGIGIPVMAILVGITSYLQQKLMAPPPSTNAAPDQSAAMMKTMNIYMPLLMAWFSYATASGLAIYFLIGNVVGVIQYAMLGKVNWRNVLPSALLPGARQAAITEKQKSGGRQK